MEKASKLFVRNFREKKGQVLDIAPQRVCRVRLFKEVALHKPCFQKQDIELDDQSISPAALPLGKTTPQQGDEKSRLLSVISYFRIKEIKGIDRCLN